MVSNSMAEVGDTIVYVVTLTNAGPVRLTETEYAFDQIPQ